MDIWNHSSLLRAECFCVLTADILGSWWERGPRKLIVRYVVYFIVFLPHAFPLLSSVSGGFSYVLFGLSPLKNLQEPSRWLSACSNPPLPNWFYERLAPRTGWEWVFLFPAQIPPPSDIAKTAVVSDAVFIALEVPEFLHKPRSSSTACLKG